MAEDRPAAELELFLAERADQLMRTAVLLTGSREAGQDLLQTALERLLRHWRTLDGDPEGYLRRTLYNLAADGFRRQGRLRHKMALLRSQAEPAADAIAGVDLREALVRLLLQLPPRQRAVLVLRFWEQLTEAEAAAVLGWPEGTVKSATARGLHRLRGLADSWPEAAMHGVIGQAARYLAGQERPGDAIVYPGAYIPPWSLAFPRTFGGLRDLSLGQTARAAGQLYARTVPRPVLLRRERGVHRIWVVQMGRAPSPAGYLASGFRTAVRWGNDYLRIRLYVTAPHPSRTAGRHGGLVARYQSQFTAQRGGVGGYLVIPGAATGRPTEWATSSIRLS